MEITVYRINHDPGASYTEFVSENDAKNWRDLNFPNAEIIVKNIIIEEEVL